MPEDEDNAPPPPYQTRDTNSSGAGATATSAAALVAANAQLRGDANDDTPRIAPPSYEATHYDASGRSRNGPSGAVAAAGSLSRTAADEWNPFSSALPESSSTDCPHWLERGCKLTSGPRRCCSCLDKRPTRVDGRYPVYIDGRGERFGSTTRWAHYCSSCKEAEKKDQTQPLRLGSVNGVSNASTEEPHLEATLRRERRRQERQAEQQRLSRAKAKHAAEQTALQHRREREREEQQQRDKAEAQNRQQAFAIDLATLERDRETLQQDIQAMEAELVLKRARLQRLDTTYDLYKRRATPSPADNKGSAPGMTEKQALALAEHEANKRAEAVEEMKEKQRQARQDNGSWFGRVFGRGSAREREERRAEERRAAEMLERTCERHTNESFYVSDRAKADAKVAEWRNRQLYKAMMRAQGEGEGEGAGSGASWPKDEKK
ncbi:hypothetical protein SCUCBS95973_008733 [Sporothrix curviconia]|uniref:Uncharacterized protein n=1 Tax=Sporothrix curviconia TaxID=1260050 RepID=A0ABP0CP34_9PEZI